MDFDRLRCLAAVARAGSMRGAAEALHVTPGAISKAIARLEAETGTTLVVPDGRGVRLTDEGSWLASRADHVVDEFAALASDFRSRRVRTPELCIASYDVFAAWFQAWVAGTWLPDVPLSLRERWPGEVEAAVANAISDVGITFYPVPTDGVDHHVVARVPLAVYVGRGAFTRTPFEELPFAVPSHPVTGSASAWGPLDGWPADRMRDVRYRASALESRLELCRSGRAAVLVPTFIVAMHNARVRAHASLVPVNMPTALARLARTVHLVHRTSMGDALAARVGIVRTALAAFCGGDE